VSYRGLRHGEALIRKWEDVDLDGAALAVRRQRGQLGWEVIGDAPKSDARERTVPLDAGTRAALTPIIVPSSPRRWREVRREGTRARRSPRERGAAVPGRHH
jgi:integrase